MERFFSSLFIVVLFTFPVFGENASTKTGKALVIIDMQAPFVTRGGHSEKPENKKKVEKIIATQVKAIEQAKELKIPIMMIEYKGFGDTNADLKAAVKDYKDVQYFIKNADGMFVDYNESKKELIKYLEDRNIGTLIITGANGGACVQSSITSALECKKSVVAYCNGIADFNFEEFIYPYKDKYSYIKAPTGCYFKEVATLEDAFDIQLRRHSVDSQFHLPVFEMELAIRSHR